MRITNDQYAKLLYEVFSSSNEKEKNSLLTGIAESIKDNRKQASLNNIENRYQAIKKKKSGQLSGIVYTVKKIDQQQISDIRKAIASKKDISEKLIELENRVDSELLGGFVVKFENEVFDGSLKNRVGKIKQALVE
jgi:F-type H+-transporting ATPase subunit delta